MRTSVGRKGTAVKKDYSLPQEISVDGTKVRLTHIFDIGAGKRFVILVDKKTKEGFSPIGGIDSHGESWWGGCMIVIDPLKDVRWITYNKHLFEEDAVDWADVPLALRFRVLGAIKTIPRNWLL